MGHVHILCLLLTDSPLCAINVTVKGHLSRSWKCSYAAVEAAFTNSSTLSLNNIHVETRVCTVILHIPLVPKTFNLIILLYQSDTKVYRTRHSETVQYNYMYCYSPIKHDFWFHEFSSIFV